MQASSPWTVTASPGPISYCGQYNAPHYLCSTWHIVDGTPAFPFGGTDYTAYDYTGMSGPPYYFTVSFGSATTFDKWRLAGSGGCNYGFYDAVLQVKSEAVPLIVISSHC